MRIGSLFSGIGGLELGLERAGVGHTVWQVEQDLFCQKVLAKHWPKARRYEGVREVGAHNLEPVDLICGGFPCQDISLAGKGEGLEGERSGLWSEYARIVRELRPRWVVIENVAALLSRGVDAVLGTLSEGGYDATWDCIPAAAVGAPHRRDRLFVVAWRVSDAERAAIRQEPRWRGGSRDGACSPFTRHLGQVVANARSERPQERHGTPFAVGSQEPGAGNRCGKGGLVANPDGGRPQGERGDGLLDGERQALGHDSDRRGGQEWPPPPGDMLAWGRVQADTQPAICRLASGLPAGLVRNRRGALRALGNAVVPQVAEVIGRMIVAAEQQRRVAERQAQGRREANKATPEEIDAIIGSVLGR